MKGLLVNLVIKGLLGSIWLLRRVDYYVAGSTALRPDEAFRVDPYTGFEMVRRRGNVLRSYANRGWLVIGYSEAQQILRDPAFSNDLRRNKFMLRLLQSATGDQPIPFIDNPPLLNQDPPNHTRLRKLASAGFTSRYIRSLEPVIQNFVSDLLDRVGDQPVFDAIDSLAEPLPAMVIAEMMGVPAGERHRFLDWSHDLVGATIISRPDLVKQASVAEQEMRAYLASLVEEKLKNPRDDFISRLVQAEVEQDQLSRSEVISTCILLLSAGHETTTRLIGNGLYTLLQHPDQLARLRADRALMDNAIEEMLRYEPPVQMTLRFLSEDRECHGHRMKAGHMVLVNLAAANRDPRANRDPATFDIGRDRVDHMAFGYGIHLCLGSGLARLEAKVAFNALFDRFPALALAETAAPRWQGNPFFRGLDRLLVSTDRKA